MFLHDGIDITRINKRLVYGSRKQTKCKTFQQTVRTLCVGGACLSVQLIWVKIAASRNETPQASCAKTGLRE